MKNKDILLDVIGDTDEKLVPELTAKKKKSNIVKWSALGGVCAAVIIGCVVLLPKSGEHSPLQQSSQPLESQSSTPSGMIADNNVYCLALAAYPEMPMYPDEMDQDAVTQWNDAKQALRNQPAGYKDGFDKFFSDTTNTFLTGAESENIVYSPLSLYMALGMSAEITDGNSRQQILDVLHQKDIDTLRSHARSIWQANYMDDGMAKCVLATSLWTNDDIDYNDGTIRSIADNYYSSVYTGDPIDEKYNKLMQDWMNEQTDGLLENYVSDIKMDPEMVLALASTVNYSGKWVDQFSAENTKQAAFHAPNGDVQCDFLNAERDMNYYWGDHFSSVSLQLENNGHMKLILPDEGYTPEDLLNDEQFGKLMLSTWDYPNNKYVIVDMSVPKFDVSANIDLRDGLNALGITDIFSAENSDYTPLTDSTDKIYLNKAEQDTRVMIDEEGCKASSLTVMDYCGAGAPDDHVEFKLDRPFIFEIMSETGLPLFVGIVNNPVQ